MIYRFSSKAAGDLVMLGANGDELLRILGREPAPKGIIEAAAMPAAIAALEAAVAAAESAPDTAADARPDADNDEEHARERGVSLRQRVWPMLEMLRRAMADDTPVVWGV
jgi:fructose-1,6-bisphosphatase/sedoheptulose 1,7-bisphosphatase-like protein